MQKKEQLKFNLNTINIPHHRKSDRSRPSNKSEKDLESGSTTTPKHMVTIEHCWDDSLEPGEHQFNDNRLKPKEKSQTLKQAHFNRLRIHVHRKDKRAKWLQVFHPSSLDSDLNLPSPDIRKQFKTASVGKRLVDYSSRQPRLKTNSSSGSAKVIRIRSPELLHRAPQVQTPVSSRFLTKLDMLLKNPDLRRELQINILQKNKEKRRNFSDGNNTLARRLAKIDPRRFLQPFSMQENRKRSSAQSREKEDSLSKENDFAAWEHEDIFASKHGIVEYIKQKTAQNQAAS